MPRSSSTTTPYWSTSVALDQADGRDRVAFAVKRDELVERQIGQIVAADHDERLVAEKRLQLSSRAPALPMQLRLVQVVELDAERDPSPSASTIASAR